MSTITHTAARLDVTVGLNDDLTLEVTVQDGDGSAIDVSGWTLEGDHCTPSIVDGSNGRIDLEMYAATAGQFTWGLRRTAPTARRLLRGSLRVTESASSDTGTDLTLQIVDDEVSVTVHDDAPGAARGDGTLSVGDLVKVKTVSPLTLEGISSGTYRKALPIDLGNPHGWAATRGAPAFGEYVPPSGGNTLTRQSVQLLADGTREGVAIPLFVPSSVPSWKLRVYWVYAGTETGDVEIRGFIGTNPAQNDGDAFVSDGGEVRSILISTVTDPGQDILQIRTGDSNSETGLLHLHLSTWGSGSLPNGEVIHLLYAAIVEA